jgi:hypothetical protein
MSGRGLLSPQRKRQLESCLRIRDDGLESQSADNAGARVLDEQFASNALPGETTRYEHIIGDQVMAFTGRKGKPEGEMHDVLQ